MTPTPWPENKDCFPRLNIPEHSVSADYKVIWRDMGTPPAFNHKDYEGIGYENYGACLLISFEGKAREMIKWTNFFSNYFDADPKADYPGESFKVWSVTRAQLDMAIKNEKCNQWYLAKHLCSDKKQEEKLNGFAIEYLNQFWQTIPERKVKDRSKNDVHMYFSKKSD